MAQRGVAAADSLANKTLMSEIFKQQAALENPLEIAGVFGVGKNCIVRVLNDQLDQGGDKITYHRKNKFTGPGHDEGEPIEGHEQALDLDDDSVLVSSKDFSGRAKSKGTADDQRTFLDLVEETMDNLVVQVAEWKSWIALAYLSGKVGTNVTIITSGFTGWAGNALVDVDSAHQFYGGDATAKANVDTSDVMVLQDLVRMKNIARTLPHKILPLRLRGKDYHVVLVHPDVWRDLVEATGTGSLFDTEKALISGGTDPATTALIGAAQMIRYGCIVIVCDQCMVYTDYGAGSNVRASRVLFCGPQAAVWARGRKTQKEEWHFEKKKFEYGKETGICATTIGGCKAVVFDSQRDAMLAFDVAAAAAA